MISNGSIHGSWRDAAAYAQTPVSSLRAAVKRGDVPMPTKGADGKLSWDVAALDALRAARAGALAGVGSVSTPANTTVNATVTPSASPAPQGSLVPVTAGWMVAATPAARVQAEDEDEDEDAGHEPPFWAVSSAPTYSNGHPIVDPATLMISYLPTSPSVSTAGAHAPGTVGAVIAEQQQQVAELQAQLAVTRAQLEAAQANAERWRLAWRHARAAGKADLISMQPRVGGEPDDCVDAVWRAAGAAADALSDAQLADDAVTFSAAHAAGVAARMAWTAEAARLARDYDGDHELARARARRGRSRTRSPRW